MSMFHITPLRVAIYFIVSFVALMTLYGTGLTRGLSLGLTDVQASLLGLSLLMLAGQNFLNLFHILCFQPGRLSFQKGKTLVRVRSHIDTINDDAAKGKAPNREGYRD